MTESFMGFMMVAMIVALLALLFIAMAVWQILKDVSPVEVHMDFKRTKPAMPEPSHIPAAPRQRA